MGSNGIKVTVGHMPLDMEKYGRVSCSSNIHVSVFLYWCLLQAGEGCSVSFGMSPVTVIAPLPGTGVECLCVLLKCFIILSAVFNQGS